MIVLDFGRFKGRELKDVPGHYLQWLVNNWNEPSVSRNAPYWNLKLSDVKAELERRTRERYQL